LSSVAGAEVLRSPGVLPAGASKYLSPGHLSTFHLSERSK
jgi:hypothetical protein